MNQQLNITILLIILVPLLSSQAPAGEVGENSSKSQLNQHGSNLFKGNNERKCDVTIIVGDKQFRAHKDILSSGSPYFETRFKSEMRGGMERQDEFKLNSDNIDAEAFEMLKDYMYTSRITIDDSTAQKLLAGASYLQMTNVKAHCCAYMNEKLEAMNCLGIKYIADTYSCVDLLQSATFLALDAFEEVALSDEFLELSLDQLISIISEDTLNVNSEEKVYEAAMRWTRHQDSSDGDRTVHLQTLMQHVRFSQMEPKYLELIPTDPLIQKCPVCLEYMKEAEKYLSMLHPNIMRTDDKAPLNARFEPRKRTKEYLLAVGGSIADGFYLALTSSVERYNPREDKWTEVASMKSPREKFGVAALNNILYAVGGLRDTQNPFLSIECYDPHTDKWTDDVKSFRPDRTMDSIAILNGMLYVIGWNEGEHSMSMVKYDPNINEWIECEPLRQKKYKYVASVLNGYIYVLGGEESLRLLNTVERYDSEQNEWHDVSPMIIKRKDFGVTAHGDYIYAVGGCGDSWRTLNSAEKYNSREDRWELISQMTKHRSGLGLAVANGLIYAVGGFGLDEGYLNTVEVYDPATNTWSKRAPMLKARAFFGLAAMKY